MTSFIERDYGEFDYLYSDIVNSDYTNNIHWINDSDTASDINDLIDEALNSSEFGDDAAVAFKPGHIHNIEGEIHVKEGVSLFGMGARVNQLADENVFFMDNGSTLVGPLSVRTQGATGYTSDAIVLDTSRTADRYNAIVGTEATVSGPITIRGDSGEGTGIAFRTDSDPIGNGVRIGWFAIDGFKNGILCNGTNGGWVQGVYMHGSIQNATNLVNQTGGEAFSSVMTGILQSNSNTDYGIRNQVANKGSLKFIGQIWDPANFGVNAVEGFGIRVRTFSGIDLKHSDGALRQVLEGVGQESANAETPTNGEWLNGDFVRFTDTGDGSGDGLYLLEPDDSWTQIGT